MDLLSAEGASWQNECGIWYDGSSLPHHGAFDRLWWERQNQKAKGRRCSRRTMEAPTRILRARQWASQVTGSTKRSSREIASNTALSFRSQSFRRHCKRLGWVSDPSRDRHDTSATSQVSFYPHATLAQPFISWHDASTNRTN